MKKTQTKTSDEWPEAIIAALGSWIDVPLVEALRTPTVADSFAKRHRRPDDHPEVPERSNHPNDFAEMLHERTD